MTREDTAARCNDGLDNDCNGFADCDDFACRSCAVPACLTNNTVTLRDGGPFTVFAPVNEAFDALPFETYISVVEDNATLTTVLTLHVVPGVYKSTDLMDLAGQTLTTVQGGKLTASMMGNLVMLRDAKGGMSHVRQADVMQSNGVIHVVDAVVLP